MSGLLWYMLKEEWRVHSTMFGSLNFILFPVMVFGISFMGSFLIPLIRAALPDGNISLILHSNYLLLGIMVGAFGLLGNEAMNRRFGQASLIAYAARTLPVSGRRIFTTFVLKDIIYYVLLWIFPFAAGFFLASYFIGIPVQIPIVLTITLTISFLFGLSAVFFLSMVYLRSPKIMVFLCACTGIGCTVYLAITGKNPLLFLLPVLLLDNFSIPNLIVSIMIVSAVCILSILIFVPGDGAHSRHHSNKIRILTSRLSFLPYPSLVAKDLIDLYRSGGAVGQIVFSFLFPLMVIWFFLSLTSGYLPLGNLFILFGITTGVIASTMYTWLTSFDNFQSYVCLPVRVSDLITGKICSFTLLQLIPVLFLSGVSISSRTVYELIPVLVLSVSISYFALSITIWFCGLSPTVLVYDIRVMAGYFLLIGTASAIFSSLAFIHPSLALTSLVLFIPVYVLIKKGLKKWNGKEMVSY